MWSYRKKIHAALSAQKFYLRCFHECSQPSDNQITHVQQQRPNRHERKKCSVQYGLPSKIAAKRGTTCVRKSINCVMQRNGKAGKYDKVSCMSRKYKTDQSFLDRIRGNSSRTSIGLSSYSCGYLHTHKRTHGWSPHVAL